MSAGGYLAPPPPPPPASTSPTSTDPLQQQTDQQKRLWTETWTRLNRFLPDLMPELFPQQQQQQQQTSVAVGTTAKDVVVGLGKHDGLAAGHESERSRDEEERRGEKEGVSATAPGMTAEVEVEDK